MSRPWSPSLFRETASTLTATARRIYDHGWSPATSSNFSCRLNDQYCAITVSGRDKGLLTESDIMVVDMDNQSATEGKPSAETALHTRLYRHLPECQAVLHTHSLASTVLTMHWPDEQQLVLQGYELLKALDGITTHEHCLVLPVFENTQNIDALAEQVDNAMNQGLVSHAYLIRGHGLYTWADNLTHCYRQLEALEHLLLTELERRKIARQA